MEVSSMLVFLFSILSQLFKLSHSKTVITVDGYSEWRNPSVHVGDSIIFKHKDDYNLYIFQNKRAFDLCNFTQATLLTKPNSTSFKWYPSRPGFFYFSFNNGTQETCDGQKLAIKVSNMALSPDLSPIAAPPPSSGGVVSSSPAYPWPFRPRQATSPSPAPVSILPATSPSLVPDKGGGNGMPFINSNPAVPLPTGEVDSATIRPLPTSGYGKQYPPQRRGGSSQDVVGFLAAQMAVCGVLFLMLL